MTGAISQAVVLCAGCGTRLGSLTSETPKAMLPIAGKPLIAHTVEKLTAAGFSDIILVVGHQGEQLRDLFHAASVVRFVEQPQPNGTAHAVSIAAEVLEERFFLTYGDLWFSELDCKTIRELSEQDGKQRIAVNQMAKPRGAALYERNGRAIRMVEKPAWNDHVDTTWNASGLYLLNDSIVDSCRRIDRSVRGELELASAIQSRIDEGDEFLLYELVHVQTDIGLAERYHALCASLSGAKNNS